MLVASRREASNWNTILTLKPKIEEYSSFRLANRYGCLLRILYLSLVARNSNLVKKTRSQMKQVSFEKPFIVIPLCRKLKWHWLGGCVFRVPLIDASRRVGVLPPYLILSYHHLILSITPHTLHLSSHYFFS